MGADIHAFIEIKNESDVWEIDCDENLKNLFKFRCYDSFGALGYRRNNINLPMIHTRSGLPENVSKSIKLRFLEGEDDYHHESYLTLKELLGVDKKNWLHAKDEDIEDNERVDNFWELQINTVELCHCYTYHKYSVNDDGELIEYYPDSIQISTVAESLYNDVQTLAKHYFFNGNLNPNKVRIVYWFDN